MTGAVRRFFELDAMVESAFEATVISNSEEASNFEG